MYVCITIYFYRSLVNNDCHNNIIWLRYCRAKDALHGQLDWRLLSSVNKLYEAAVGRWPHTVPFIRPVRLSGGCPAEDASSSASVATFGILCGSLVIRKTQTRDAKHGKPYRVPPGEFIGTISILSSIYPESFIMILITVYPYCYWAAVTNITCMFLPLPFLWWNIDVYITTNAKENPLINVWDSVSICRKMPYVTTLRKMAKWSWIQICGIRWTTKFNHFRKVNHCPCLPISAEIHQRVRELYILRTDGRTDRQTDTSDHNTYCGARYKNGSRIQSTVFILTL